jgi:hypothetical protein
MMGTKILSFTPLPPDISLEDLVAEDHFYRRLEARLDLSFVRELVEPLYAQGGRPSVDPVVFFKPQPETSREIEILRDASPRKEMRC